MNSVQEEAGSPSPLSLSPHTFFTRIVHDGNQEEEEDVLRKEDSMCDPEA